MGHTPRQQWQQGRSSGAAALACGVSDQQALVAAVICLTHARLHTDLQQGQQNEAGEVWSRIAPTARPAGSGLPARCSDLRALCKGPIPDAPGAYLCGDSRKEQVGDPPGLQRFVQAGGPEGALAGLVDGQLALSRIDRPAAEAGRLGRGSQSCRHCIQPPKGAPEVLRGWRPPQVPGLWCAVTAFIRSNCWTSACRPVWCIADPMPAPAA